MLSKLQTWWVGLSPVLGITVAAKNDGKSLWQSIKSSWDKSAGTLFAKVGLKLPMVEGKTTTSPAGLPIFTWKLNGRDTIVGAKGGILSKAAVIGRLGNTDVVGGEAGREALLPLERNTGWMDTIAERVRDTLTRDSYGDQSAMNRILDRLDDIEAQLASIGADTRRQADKESNTYLSIGGRALRDAVVRQTEADGYSFT